MINYQYIADAVSFYKDCGYNYVDVPWIVPYYINDITRPKTAKQSFNTFMGELVASGEQSFLDQIVKGNLLPNNYYVCCTPCFRDEENKDNLHLPYFMKVELIWFQYTCQSYCNGAYSKIVNDAFSFFSDYIDCKIINTNDGQDIITLGNDIELGSYGTRMWYSDKLKNASAIQWVYGTGCAEPRLSFCVKNGR